MNYPKPNKLSDISVYVATPPYISVPQYQHNITIAGSWKDLIFNDVAWPGSNTSSNLRTAIIIGVIVCVGAIAFAACKKHIRDRRN